MNYDLNLVKFVISALAVAGVVSFATTPLVKQFAQTVGAVDVPRDSRRMHKVPIPRMGGLAIFFGFLVSTLIFYTELDNYVRGVLLGGVVIVVLGIIDDIHPLKAWIKLIGQIFASLVAVYHGIVITTLSNPNLFSPEPYLELGDWAVPVTIVWIVIITNSVNLIDGLDGLAVGVSSIACLFMLIIAILVSQSGVAIIMAALAGACIGFMPYNVNPAKIFMGDTGATFLGYVLAVVSIQGLFKVYTIMSFAIPFLILGLPIFDTAFAIVRRLISGRSPMSPDRSHVHHRLIDMGFSQKQSVAILYTMSGILGLTAVVLTTSGEKKAMIFVACLLAAGFIGYKVFTSSEKSSGGSDENGTDEALDTKEFDTAALPDLTWLENDNSDEKGKSDDEKD